MEATAKLRHLKGSPRKARLVIDLIRGQRVSRALSILKFTEKRAADPIAQCLNSAIANATYAAEQKNIAIDPDDLWINLCYVDMGPTKGRKRMRPAPQGRAYREQRHYCHITIQVTSEEKPKTEEQLRLEALRDERIAARKAANAKKKAEAPAKKKEVAAPVEEVTAADTAAVEETVVETPAVEEVAAADAVAVEETVEAASEEVAAATEETVESASDEVEAATEEIEVAAAEDAPAEDAPAADETEGEESEEEKKA